MQKTAYEMRISDWSSDVCSADLTPTPPVDMERIRQFTSRPPSGPFQVRGIFQVRHSTETQPCDRTNGSGQVTQLSHKLLAISSDERSVGTEWHSTCRTGWSPYH